MSGFDFSGIGSDSNLDANTPLKEGTFHFAVDSVNPNHTSKKKGTHGIELVLTVLAGTEDQKNKKLYERFYLPTPDQTEQGRDFMLRRLAKIARTLDLIAEDDLKGANVVVPWEKAAGRQFVATVVHNIDDETKKVTGAQIDGLKMYKVTDDDVAEIPKDKASLQMITGAGGGGETPKPATNIADL
jgi:hypothetical protein